MNYNAFRHTLEEDNGELIAIFEKSVRADKAFEICDKINDYESFQEVKWDLENLEEEYDDLEKKYNDQENKFWKLEQERKETIEKFDNRIEGIIQLIKENENSEINKLSNGELIQDILEILSSPLP